MIKLNETEIQKKREEIDTYVTDLLNLKETNPDKELGRYFMSVAYNYLTLGEYESAIKMSHHISPKYLLNQLITDLQSAISSTNAIRVEQDGGKEIDKKEVNNAKFILVVGSVLRLLSNRQEYEDVVQLLKEADLSGSGIQ